MAKSMAAGYGKAHRVKVISESGTTARPKALACISQNWVTGTRASFTIHKNTASALSASTTAKLMWVNTAAIAPTARANTSGPTATITRGNLSTT